MNDRSPATNERRHILIKFGKFLKFKTQRWYELNPASNSIDYFTSENSKKLKGRILLSEIYETKISSTGKDQSSIEVTLTRGRKFFLLESDINKLRILQSELEQFRTSNRELPLQTHRQVISPTPQQRAATHNIETSLIRSQVQMNSLNDSTFMEILPQSALSRGQTTFEEKHKPIINDLKNLGTLLRGPVVSMSNQHENDLRGSQYNQDLSQKTKGANQPTHWQTKSSDSNQSQVYLVSECQEETSIRQINEEQIDESSDQRRDDYRRTRSIAIDHQAHLMFFGHDSRIRSRTCELQRPEASQSFCQQYSMWGESNNNSLSKDFLSAKLKKVEELVAVEQPEFQKKYAEEEKEEDDNLFKLAKTLIVDEVGSSSEIEAETDVNTIRNMQIAQNSNSGVEEVVRMQGYHANSAIMREFSTFVSMSSQYFKNSQISKGATSCFDKQQTPKMQRKDSLSNMKASVDFWKNDDVPLLSIERFIEEEEEEDDDSNDRQNSMNRSDSSNNQVFFSAESGFLGEGEFDDQKEDDDEDCIVLCNQEEVEEEQGNLKQLEQAEHTILESNNPFNSSALIYARSSSTSVIEPCSQEGEFMYRQDKEEESRQNLPVLEKVPSSQSRHSRQMEDRKQLMFSQPLPASQRDLESAMQSENISMQQTSFVSRITESMVTSQLSTVVTSRRLIQKAINLSLNFRFVQAEQIWRDPLLFESSEALESEVVSLLLEFVFSLNETLLRRVCEVCERGISIILSIREKSNVFLAFVQNLSLIIFYGIKGAIQFTKNSKILGLFAIKNAFSYLDKCLKMQRGDDVLFAKLSLVHRRKLDLIEGLYHIAAGTLPQQMQSILGAFSLQVQSQKGFQLLVKVSQSTEGKSMASSRGTATLRDKDFDGKKELRTGLEEYRRFLREEKVEVSSLQIDKHIAITALVLHLIKRDKNTTFARSIMLPELMKHPKSPLFHWLHSLIFSESHKYEYSLSSLNKALKFCGVTSHQFVMLKFEKACILIRLLRFEQACEKLVKIGLSLVVSDGFRSEDFQKILTGRRSPVQQSIFVTAVRVHGMEVKQRGRVVFPSINKFIQLTIAALIASGRTEEAREWMHIPAYFKKYSSSSGGFINENCLEVNEKYLLRENLTLVKYEILYLFSAIKFTEEIVESIEAEVTSSFSTPATPIPPIERASALMILIILAFVSRDRVSAEECQEKLSNLLTNSSSSKSQLTAKHTVYIVHHSYFWLSKFWTRCGDKQKASAAFSLFKKFPSNIFSLSIHADSINAKIQSIGVAKTTQQRKAYL